jgi:hypothetical protein
MSKERINKRLPDAEHPYARIYRETTNGIAWVEDGSTGIGHSCHPNIDASGSVSGMKNLGYWDKNDVVLKSHGFKYNVSRFTVGDQLDEIAATYCECPVCRERKKITQF